jgi:5-methylcytosine-specific restriction endonuclease McrA
MICRIKFCKREAAEGVTLCHHHRELKKQSYKRTKTACLARSRKYAIENKEKVATYQREHYLKNEEKLKKYIKEYKNENTERIQFLGKRRYNEIRDVKIEYSRKYYKEHREEQLLRYKEYRTKNREKIIARNRLWRLNNPDVCDRSRNLRRVRKHNAYVAHVYRSEIFTRDNWICQLCGKPVVTLDEHYSHPFYPTLDHILPLSKGGTHEPANVQTAHRRCNGSKGNRVIGKTTDEQKLFEAFNRIGA